MSTEDQGQPPEKKGCTQATFTPESYKLSELITAIGDVEVRLCTEKGLTYFRNGFTMDSSDYAKLDSWRMQKVNRRHDLAHWRHLSNWSRAWRTLLGWDHDTKVQEERL